MALAPLSACVAYAPAPIDVAHLAQTLHTEPLPADRHALLALALERSAIVQAARAGLTAAQAGARSARNLPPLTLTLTAEYSKQADAQRPWLYSGALGVPLDLGGRRQGRVTTADLAVVKAHYALADAVWATRQSLMQGLSDLSGARAQIAATQTLIDRRKQYLALIAKRAAAGEDNRGLAVQAQLDASALVDGLLQAQARAAQARADLARVLDVPVSAVDALPDLPDTAIPDDTQLTAMSDQALYTRSEVLNAVVDYDSAENDLRTAIAGQYPDINLAPGYTWERGVVKLPLAGTFTLPPLDGNRANIDQAQAARTAAGKTLEDQVRTIQATVRQADLTWRSDRALAEKTRHDDLPLAEDLLRRSERMTASGETDRTETLTAQIALDQAQMAAVSAEQTARDDRLKLEDALHQAFDANDTRVLTQAVAPPEVTK